MHIRIKWDVVFIENVRCQKYIAHKKGILKSDAHLFGAVSWKADDIEGDVV